MRNVNNYTTAIEQVNRPGFVSPNYAFIQTAPIITSILEQGFELNSIRQARTRKIERQGFEKHQLIFTHPTQGADSDSVLRCLVRNSHDRTSALEFHLGFFRFACENGLIVGSSLMGSFKVYHTGNIQDKINETIHKMLLNVPKVIETREAMRSKVLTLQQCRDFDFNAAAIIRDIRKVDVSSSEHFNLDVIRREADMGLDLWSTFNRVQESALGALTGVRTTTLPSGEVQRKVIRSRKIKSLDIDTRLNTKLFDLALGYL